MTYMNIVYLHNNIDILDYIVNILLEKIIYIIKNNILNIAKNVIQKQYIIV